VREGKGEGGRERKGDGGEWKEWRIPPPFVRLHKSSTEREEGLKLELALGGQTSIRQRLNLETRSLDRDGLLIYI
jgi:hypothetical protein